MPQSNCQNLIGCLCLQEGALTALASVADAANAHFIRYYDTVMPMLKNVLYNARNKTEQLLRAKALECVSLVGMAVGKERFRADAQEVMAFMQQLQVCFWQAPQTGAVRLCCCMHQALGC